MGHNERAHALLSASGAHRWLACPPSARLEEQFPDTTSEAAKEGTLAHELAEVKLRHYFHTTDFGKRKYTAAVNKLKKQETWQEEMQGYTDEYLDFVKTTALGFEAAPYVAIEKKVDLSGYVPEGFGTADCILIGGGTIHVIDFKYGKGVPVSVRWSSFFVTLTRKSFDIIMPAFFFQMVSYIHLMNVGGYDCNTHIHNP